MSDLGQELERLRRLIGQWNANRLDLFEISQPAEDLTFHGVMRFFYHEAGSKVATKCLRVANTATCAEVVHVLFEKFRPDMRMLTTTSANYCLCEVRGNGGERYLDDADKPLLVQLNWHKDDLEGRFTLRRRPTLELPAPVPAPPSPENDKPDGVFRRLSRRMSGRRSRSKERTEKGLSRRSSSLSRLGKKADSRRSSEVDVLRGSDRARSVSDISGAESDASPDRVSSTFTRSISNPEAVMRRRREQKLVKKINSFRGKNGKPDSGGTLKVFGGELMPSVPYKTILAAVDDKVPAVVRQALDKYGMEDVDSNLYSLSMAVQPKDSNNPVLRQERKLAEDECPLKIIQGIQEADVLVSFHLQPKNGHFMPANKQGMGHAPWFLKKGDLPSARRVHTEPSSPELSEQQHQGGSLQQLNMENGDAHQHVVSAPVQRAQSLGILGQPNTSGHKEQPRMGDNKQVAMAKSETHLAQGKGLQNGLSNQVPWHSLPDHHQSSPTVHKSASQEYASVHRQKFSKTDRQITDGKRHGSAPEGGYLPCVLIVQRGQEDRLLQFVVTDTIPSEVKFKLSPAYTLYLAARCLLRRSAHNETQRVERKRTLCSFLNKAITRINMSLEDTGHQAEDSAFWLANSSELLHFLKNDPKLSPMTYSCQDGLHSTLEVAFNSLTNSLHEDLQGYLPAFLGNLEDFDPHRGAEDGSQPRMEDFIAFMQHCLKLLQNSLLNATILVQVFSQLFHYTSALLFNEVVSPQRGLCSQRTGVLLLERLHVLQQWSKDNGLELASSMNLIKITQTAKLLASSKSRYQDAAAITASCFKLNSLQISALLRLYRYEEGEPPMLPGLVQQLVLMAENTIDDILRSDNVEVSVEEEERLPSNFNFPEERFSCDVVIGVPPGLQEFLQLLTNTGVGQFALSPNSDGSWMSWKATSPTELAQTLPGVGGEGRTLAAEGTVSQPGASEEASPHARETAKIQHSDGRTGMSQGEEQFPAKPARLLTRDQRPGSGKHNRPKRTLSPPTLPPPPPMQDEEVNQVQPANTEAKEDTVLVDGVLLPVRDVSIFKGKEGLGISIVGGVGVESVVGDSGIYIKTVIPGRAAHRDGCLEEGDQLLAIDGHNLIGVSQEEAAMLVRQTGDRLTIRVAKQAFSVKRDLRQHLLSQQDHEQSEGDLLSGETSTTARDDLAEADRDVKNFQGKMSEGNSQELLSNVLPEQQEAMSSRNQSSSDHDQGIGQQPLAQAPTVSVTNASPKTKVRRTRRQEQTDSSSAETTPRRSRKKGALRLQSVREGAVPTDSESLASVTEDNLKLLKSPPGYSSKRRPPSATSDSSAVNGHTEQLQLMLWLKEQQEQRALQQQERERSQQEMTQGPLPADKSGAEESSIAESSRHGEESESAPEHSSGWQSENPSVTTASVPGASEQGAPETVHLQQPVEYWADDDNTALAVRMGQKWGGRQLDKDIHVQERPGARKDSHSSDTGVQPPRHTPDDLTADPEPYTTVGAIFSPQHKSEHSSPQKSAVSSQNGGTMPGMLPVYALPDKKKLTGSQPTSNKLPDVRYAQVNKPSWSHRQAQQQPQPPSHRPPEANHQQHEGFHTRPPLAQPQQQQTRHQPVHQAKSVPPPPTRVDSDRGAANAWYEAVDVTGGNRGNSAGSQVRQITSKFQAGPQSQMSAVGVRTVGQSSNAMSGGLGGQGNSRTISPPAQHGTNTSQLRRPPPPQRRDSLLTNNKAHTKTDPEQVHHGQGTVMAMTTAPHTQTSHFQGSYTQSQAQRPSQPVVSAGNRLGQPLQNGVRSLNPQHVEQSQAPSLVQNSTRFQQPSQPQSAVHTRPPALELPPYSQASSLHTSPFSAGHNPTFSHQSQGKTSSRVSPMQRNPPGFPQANPPPARSMAASAPSSAGYNTKRPEDSFRSPNAPKGGSHFTFNAAPRPSSPNMPAPFEIPYAVDIHRGLMGSVSQPTSGTATPRYGYGPGAMYRPAASSVPVSRQSGAPASNGVDSMPPAYGAQSSHTPTPYTHHTQKGPAGVQRSVSLREQTPPDRHLGMQAQPQRPYYNQQQQQRFPPSHAGRIHRPEMEEMMRTPSSSTQSLNKINQNKGRDRPSAAAPNDFTLNEKKRFFARGRPSGPQQNGLPTYPIAQLSNNAGIQARPPWHAEPGLV